MRQHLSIITLIIAFLPAGSAGAAGFYVQEQSSAYQGLSFAGAAADPVDASILYYNPAGLTYLNGAQSSVGVSLIVPSLRMNEYSASVTTGGTTESITATSSDGGNPYRPSPVPHGYLAMPVGPGQDTWVGVGVSFPFGMASEYEPDSYARYDSIKSVLKVMDVAPSFATRINDRVSLGAALNIQHADGQLTQAFPNPATAPGVPDPSTDGYQDLSGSDVSFGYNIGLMMEPFDHTRVGLHYRSEINHDIDGRLITRLPAALGGTDLRYDGVAKLKLPEIATLAVAHDVNDRLTVQGHAIWFGWSNFDDLPVDLSGAADTSVPQHYQDSWSLALGAKYQLNDDWGLKAGYQYEQTPTKDGFRTTRTPDGDRHWVSGGATYRLSDRIDLDLAATYIRVMPSAIDLYRAYNTGTVRIMGETDADIGIFSAGLRYKF